MASRSLAGSRVRTSAPSMPTVPAGVPLVPILDRALPA
jgi:hypothetical protein